MSLLLTAIVALEDAAGDLTTITGDLNSTVLDDLVRRMRETGTDLRRKGAVELATAQLADPPPEGDHRATLEQIAALVATLPGADGFPCLTLSASTPAAVETLVAAGAEHENRWRYVAAQMRIGCLSIDVQYSKAADAQEQP